MANGTVDYKLGTIDAKLDDIIKRFEGLDKRMEKIELRTGVLENANSKAAGFMIAVSAVVGIVISNASFFLQRFIEHK